MNKPSPHYLGHRNRLRTKVISGNCDSLNDYELLELILFSVHSRKDLKPLSKDLLTRFGDLKGVFSAPIEELRLVEGMGESTIATIKSIKTVLERLLLQDVQSKQILGNWKAIIEYLCGRIGQAKVENFIVLFMNNKNHLIETTLNQHGTVDQISVYIREIVKKALFLGASSIIVSHNHPSGDPKPSEADQLLTDKLQFACESTEIKFLDHIIVTRNSKKHFSFRENGML